MRSVCLRNLEFVLELPGSARIWHDLSHFLAICRFHRAAAAQQRHASFRTSNIDQFLFARLENDSRDSWPTGLSVVGSISKCFL